MITHENLLLIASYISLNIISNHPGSIEDDYPSSIIIRQEEERKLWNPLTNVSDALIIAKVLQMDIDFNTKQVSLNNISYNFTFSNFDNLSLCLAICNVGLSHVFISKANSIIAI